MVNVKKAIIVAVLLVIAVVLTWFVWLETKVLVITLALLAACILALYFVIKKM